MKKLLLSSVIMLGVCSIATAQADTKVSPAPKNTFATAASSTPQKSTVAASDVAPVAQTDKAVPANAPTLTKAEAVAASVRADGTVSPADEAKQREEKLAKANEPAAPKVVLGKHKNKN